MYETLKNRLGEWISLERDVLTLSGALFIFSLAMQMTTRFLPEYMAVLGAGSVVIGFYGTFEEIVNSIYPYPGGKISDRFGNRGTLVCFGALTTLGFLIWFAAPYLHSLNVFGTTLSGWIWIFVGIIFVLAWKELGMGATFALVKNSVPPNQLARGFASTEVFRRFGYLLGPLIASGILWYYSQFISGFQVILAGAVGVSLLATVLQWKGYRAAENQLEKKSKKGGKISFQTILRDFQRLPPELRPLLIGDTLVRFANGMAYIFFILVVTRYHELGWSIAGWEFSPASFFGILLGIEMTVALVSMVPAARIGDALGQKPVVGFGFFVYAVFPVIMITVPSNPYIFMFLFAFSGLRFAGMAPHKALIVGPARQDEGGTTTGVYYLIRNTLRTPAPAVGGVLYEFSPEVSFTTASIIGVIGVGYFFYAGQPLET